MHLRQDKVFTKSPTAVFNSGIIKFNFLLIIISAVTAYSDDHDSKKAAYMGVGSCSSSNCHGSVSPRNATKVLQNEYVTWEKHDSHSKAWINLTNEDSKRIAYNLGIKSAESEPWCLRCHATYLESNDRKGANYHIEDGVSCESCHGAAENYLGPHTANDTNHEKNLQNGMLDIVDYDKRVKLCASCHFGQDNKYVNHRLIGAGHPRLTFELDTFTMIQPKHWVLDQDYLDSKSDYDSARAWLIGQISFAKLTLDRLSSEKLSKDGIFPELTLFNCYACHHSLTEEQWKQREYSGRPGELQLNLTSLITTKLALQVINPEISQKLSANIDNLHKSYKDGSKNDIQSLNQQLTAVRKEINSSKLSHAELKKILVSLVSYGSNSLNTQYELAEQIAMGCSAILASLSPDGKLYKSELDAVYASLNDPKSFKLDEFIKASKEFEAALN